MKDVGGYAEKTAIIILTIMLFAGSFVLYIRNTRPFSKITIVEDGIKEELTLSQVEALLKESIKVDINKASTKDLQRIPGIGEVMAARIVEYRELRGPFSCHEDLLEIEGIGEKKLAGIKAYLKEDLIPAEKYD